MPSVFSHIIQKRLSQQNEDVATDALAYILESSDAAKKGMMKLLNGACPDLPTLRFRTQQTEGSIRPDMWGFAGSDPRVYVENKFWAGVTDNQPVSYLNRLATYGQPTVLLVVAPLAREHTLWRELLSRVHAAGITSAVHAAGVGVSSAVRVSSGPIMAITSWESVLASIDGEAAHDASARADIAQLKALCDAADIDAFTPVTSEELTDQRIPAFLTQLGSIVQQVTQAGVNEQILSVRGLNPQANWDRIGRYMQIPLRKRCVVWLGINFRLWKTHGASPLWMVFQLDEIGRIRSLGKAFSDWRNLDGTAAIADGDDYVVPIMIPPGEEQSEVVRSVVEQMRSISVSLEAFLPQPSLEPPA